MTDDWMVQGRMVTPESLAELIEDDGVRDARPIEEADGDCPECEGNVFVVEYWPSVIEVVTGYKCQDCNWWDTDRELLVD